MIDEDKSTLPIRESAYVTRAIEDIRKRDIPNRTKRQAHIPPFAFKYLV